MEIIFDYNKIGYSLAVQTLLDISGDRLYSNRLAVVLHEVEIRKTVERWSTIRFFLKIADEVFSRRKFAHPQARVDKCATIRTEKLGAQFWRFVFDSVGENVDEIDMNCSLRRLKRI